MSIGSFHHDAPFSGLVALKIGDRPKEMTIAMVKATYSYRGFLGSPDAKSVNQTGTHAHSRLGIYSRVSVAVPSARVFSHCLGNFLPRIGCFLTCRFAICVLRPESTAFWPGDLLLSPFNM